MHATTNNERKLAAFTVVRSYQPTRIERELLAQVFELASHGVINQSDVTGGHHQLRNRATQEAADHELSTPESIACRDAHDCQPERAA